MVAGAAAAVQVKGAAAGHDASSAGAGKRMPEAVHHPFAAATSYGARSYLEDFYSAGVLLNNMALFGVFDGHGEANVAEFCAGNICSEVEARLEELGDLHRGLKGAFLQMDEYLRAEYEQQQQQQRHSSGDEEECCAAGSTAVVAVLDYRKRRVVVANVGDSRAILSRNGRAIDLARPHEPEDAEERARIEAAGGTIMPNGYLSTSDEASSTLSMSRSIGDFEFKMDKSRSWEQQLVIAVPEILEEELSGHEDFLVLTSDGIWMPSQEIVDFVANMQSKQGLSLPVICNRLIDKADANDNMTVLIVPLFAGAAAEASPAA